MDLLSPTLPFIADVQKYRDLALPMKFLSILGTEYFYLFLLPLIYWGVSRPIGLRLGALLLFSVIVNEMVKVGFAQPRPYWLDPKLLIGQPENSFGLPSGHAQNAFLIWLFLALQTHKRRLWVPLALLLAISISFSRVYLGVHFPTDTLAGAAIGLVILGCYKLAGPAWMRFWRQLSTFQKITFAVFATAFLAAIYCIAMITGTNGYYVDYNSPALKTIQNATSGAVIAPRLAAFLGLLIGSTLAHRFLNFNARVPLQPLLLRFFVGFTGLMIIYFGIAKITPGLIVWKFLRYGMISFWVIYLAPLVFEKLNLGENDQIATPA
jgi:membrane-associated phospholipid phosphatase